ncbi:MAG TPA: DoxX family protein [Micropepsaceae bacterium]|nr:DoxX family protein [Micropepsaceae bacterium]
MAVIGMSRARLGAAADIGEDAAKLILRVTVSVLILLHTWAVINGEQAIRDTLMRWDLPVGLAWSAVVFEGIAPIMVILGIYARIGAWMMTFWMVMAFLLAHVDTGHIFQLAQNGVGWRVEGPFFFLACSLCVALLGAGRYGAGIGGKWNE